MEQWEVEFKWLRIRHFVKDTFQKEKLPDLNAILLSIGINELGVVKQQFSRSEKEDLLHIAACRLMSYDGYYEFVGMDEDGWPHWRQIRTFDQKGLISQEKWLKEKIIAYFSNLHIFDTNEEE